MECCPVVGTMDFSPSLARMPLSRNLSLPARMPLTRTFPDHTVRSLESAQQQLPPPASSVQTRASFGRFAGTFHWINGRKRPGRRHTGQQDNDDRERESLHNDWGKETIDEHLTEDSDSHGFCDDVPYDKDTDANVKKRNSTRGSTRGVLSDSHMHDSHVFCDDVPYDKDDVDVKRNNTRGLLSDIHMYDSIHGEFWSNDPYYREIETSESEEARQKLLPGELNRESAQAVNNSAGRLAEGSSIARRDFIQTVDIGRQRSGEDLMEANGKSGNGDIPTHETMDTSLLEDTRSISPASVIQGDGFASPPIKETCEFSKESVSSNMAEHTRMADSVSALKRDQHFSINHQKPIFLQIDRGKDIVKVREIGSAERPADSLGSLQNVESDEVEGRQCSGNEEVNGTDFEGTSVTKLALDGSLGDSDSLSPGHFGSSEACLFSTDEVEGRQFSGNEEVNGTDFDGTSVTKLALDGSLGDLDSLSPGHFGSSEACLFSTDDASIAEETGNQVAKIAVQRDGVVEQVGQVVEQVAELIPGSIEGQVANVVDHMEKLQTQVSQVAEQAALKVVDQIAEQAVLKVVDQVAEVLPDPMVEQVGQVAEHISHLSEQINEQGTSHVVESISSTASSFLSTDEDGDESDEEFEAYVSSDIPEFKGVQGLNHFMILQEDQGIISILYDFFIFMLKGSLYEFVLGMLAAPILLSVIFTILYLPEFDGLALDETAREFGSNGQGGSLGLLLSWQTIFQVFMFSVSLSTGLQTQLAPLSPYTLVVANLNALIAQLIFVFLSGAVFARLSQPSKPIKCSSVALVCPSPRNLRLKKEARHKALLTRYVLVGPQPCELVDVKVDLTYKYNTVTRSGTYFRTSRSLKLVRAEIPFLNHIMLVRHIIDETSPLYERTQGMLEKEDTAFSLSVVGLERSSMQAVFHVQHYCVYDGDVIWDAEFEDMILMSKKKMLVVDHSLLSKWRSVSAG